MAQVSEGARGPEDYWEAKYLKELKDIPRTEWARAAISRVLSKGVRDTLQVSFPLFLIYLLQFEHLATCYSLNIVAFFCVTTERFLGFAPSFVGS